MERPAETTHSSARQVLAMVGVLAMPMPWIAARFIPIEIPDEAVAVASGVAILGSAFMLSWATELAERDLPQSLAILLLALLAVLPEYAVDLTYAWTAASDPSYAAYAAANMTGANRLLIGIGWPLVVLVACWKSREPALEIHPRQKLEIRFLLWATLYSLLIPLTNSINLIDAAVLLGFFCLYAYRATQSESVEVELVGPPALIERTHGDFGRRFWAAGLFAFAGFGIFISAPPFAHSLVDVGRAHAMDEFLLVQWVAPLASESPEFLVMTLFALRGRGSLGIGALISSLVNQWTLLVAAIPIAYSLASGAPLGLPLDERQRGELWLTSVQSLMAVVFIADLRFSRLEALMLTGLFLGQFLFTTPEVRYAFIVAYLVVAVGLLLFGGARRRAEFFAMLRPRRG